jgi:hypothetical protein
VTVSYYADRNSCLAVLVFEQDVTLPTSCGLSDLKLNSLKNDTKLRQLTPNVLNIAVEEFVFKC